MSSAGVAVVVTVLSGVDDWCLEPTRGRTREDSPVVDFGKIMEFHPKLKCCTSRRDRSSATLLCYCWCCYELGRSSGRITGSPSRDRKHRTGLLVDHFVGTSWNVCLTGEIRLSHGIQNWKCTLATGGVLFCQSPPRPLFLLALPGKPA